MNHPVRDDPIRTRVRASLAEACRGRLERAVLYGSRARGDHGPGSDYDIAVFIRNPGTFSEESAHLVLCHLSSFTDQVRRLPHARCCPTRWEELLREAGRGIYQDAMYSHVAPSERDQPVAIDMPRGPVILTASRSGA